MTSPFSIFLDIRKMSKRRALLTIIFVSYFILTFAWSQYLLLKSDFEIDVPSLMVYVIGTSGLGLLSWRMYLKENFS
jgi:hypothetical protein